MLQANKFQNALAYQHPEFAKRYVKEQIQIMSMEYQSGFLKTGEFTRLYSSPKTIDSELELITFENMLRSSLSLSVLRRDEANSEKFSQKGTAKAFVLDVDAEEQKNTAMTKKKKNKRH